MEKNVEFNVSGIKCDNPNCDYSDMSVKFEVYSEYVNKPCPKCGEVLLTQEQHEQCLMFQKVADTINSLSEQEIADITKNISPEDVEKSLQTLKELGVDYEIKFVSHEKISKKAICVSVDRLPGNSIAPELELNKEYTILDVAVCGCGQEHYDVGLASEYNYINCWDCKKPIQNGDKIHWCHPSRFEINGK